MGHHVTLPPAEELQLPADHPWRKTPKIGAVLGILCFAIAWFAGGEHGQFFHSYLAAFLFTLGLALGSLFFTLFQHAASAGWSVVVRRTAENLMAPLPVFILLFIPIFLGRHELYHHWMGEHALHDKIVQGKAAFLNEGFWMIRAAGYLLVWTLLSWWFRSKSVAQDSEGGEAITRTLQSTSYPSVIAFALTISFAGIDWAMSLDPHWYSTMWGVYYFANSIVSAFALLGLTLLLLRERGVLADVVNEEHYHDIGKFVFAFTVFWAYIGFSQYFLIWYANIPEETMFYSRRGGSWSTLGAVLMVGHFAIPFLFLMGRSIKRYGRSLKVACIWVIAFCFLDIYYVVMPMHHSEGITVSAADIFCLVGMLSIYAAVATRFMASASLVPLKDPRLNESLAFTNI